MGTTKAKFRVVASECCKVPEGLTFTLLKLGTEKLEILHDDTDEKVILAREWSHS